MNIEKLSKFTIDEVKESKKRIEEVIGYHQFQPKYEKAFIIANAYLEEALMKMTIDKLAFIDDKAKMYDFTKMEKDDFLASYSYLTEEEYDATEYVYNHLNNDEKNVIDNITVEEISKCENNEQGITKEQEQEENIEIQLNTIVNNNNINNCKAMKEVMDFITNEEQEEDIEIEI